MIQPDGNVKVLDFGLATGFKFGVEPISSADSTLEMEEPTPRGIIGGTFRYMSPEQVRGEPLDLQTDIFSLGILIYEMVTGCRPFDGRDPGDVLQSILATTPVPLTEHVPDLPFELQSIVSKALSKDKAHRYLSISGFQADWARLKSYLRSADGRPQLVHGVDDFFRKVKAALPVVKESTKGRPRRRPSNDLVLVLHAMDVPRPTVTGILRQARAEGLSVVCPTEQRSMFYEYAETLRTLIPSVQCVVYLCSSPSESIEKGWAGFAKFLAVRSKKRFHAICLDAD
jgi:serine/threonine protein kinase